MDTFEKKDLKKKSKNLSSWYNDIILKSQLADYGPVRGTMVIRPYGYEIWENLQSAFNKMMQERKEGPVRNAYFPLLIPYSYLQREKDHVKGFSPELALVTIGGGEKLHEPLVVRPTSETIMYEMYSKWIKSWRDLPLLINQWNNVVRWEKRTYLFLRTLEFLWQEGHTAHESESEAISMALDALEWYREIYEDYCAVPVIVGEKSDSEKFAGAKTTWSVEALMPDGKALQGATSHNLGQNFSKVFNISYQDKKGSNNFVWQTSWGLSTRSLGGMFMTHGDDNGLILPPKIAPIKTAIIPIFGKKDDEIIKYSEKVKEKIESSKSQFPGRVEIFSDPEKSFGYRINETEIKGIPVRIEIGSRELEEKTLTLSFRMRDMDKRRVRVEDISEELEKELATVQQKLFQNALLFRNKNTKTVEDYKEFKTHFEEKRGFVKAFWCGKATCESKIKEETKATTRVKHIGEKQYAGKCIYCGVQSNSLWFFGQSY